MNTFLNYLTISDRPDSSADEKKQWTNAKKWNTDMLVKLKAQMVDLVTQLNNIVQH